MIVWIKLLNRHSEWIQFQKGWFSFFTLSWFTSCKFHFWPGNKEDFLPEHVCGSERGACVCTQSFSLACHPVEIDGEKMSNHEKPSLMLSRQSGNVWFCAPVAHSGWGGILTSLGRGSWECGWTSALGCSLVGGYWLSSDNSISPPGWWVWLKGTCTGWFQGLFPS